MTCFFESKNKLPQFKNYLSKLFCKDFLFLKNMGVSQIMLILNKVTQAND